MLISLHLPKTAGSSFASSLSSQFGDKLKKDYSDYPLHKSSSIRHSNALIHSGLNFFKYEKNIKCIHGHFLPLKYKYLRTRKKKQYITWMRDPAERLASQYFYMRRHYSEEKIKQQTLLKKMIDEDWSLERFCLGKELQNTYSKFLWRFPIHKFNFIGIVEHYDTELDYFSNAFLDEPLKHYHQNINPIVNHKASYFDNEAFKQTVIKHHAKDYKLYNTALNLAHKQNRI